MGASFGMSAEWSGPAIVTDGVVAVEGASREGGRRIRAKTAPTGNAIPCVVARAGYIVSDGAAGEAEASGCGNNDATANGLTIAAVVSAPRQVAHPCAVFDRSTARVDADAAAKPFAECRRGGSAKRLGAGDLAVGDGQSATLALEAPALACTCATLERHLV